MEDNISHSLFGRPEDGIQPTEISHDIWQVSEEVKRMFMIVNVAIISTCVSVFGICSNIINFAVFIKQGFKETINLTLLAITISDICSLITLLWKAICHNPVFVNAVTPLLSEEIQFLTGGIVHVIFVRITGWLTAFLTFERCVCVLFPLKVKSISTPTRNKLVIAVIYFFNIATVLPFYAAVTLNWKYVPEMNRTMFGLVYKEASGRLLNIGYTLIGLPNSLPFTIIVVTSTLILVSSLKRQSKWRQKTAANEKTGVTKEKAVIKMVIAIALVLIVCLFIPSLINIPLKFVSGFTMTGKYGNLHLIIVSFIFVLESINSAVNIFVYYSMSSNYRHVFQELFLRHKKRVDNVLSVK